MVSAMETPHPITGEALVHTTGTLWIPFDKARLRMPDAPFSALSAHLVTHHGERHPVQIDHAAVSRLLIINGMGVTLGDSIIGLTALKCLLQRHPHLAITLWRSCATPPFVEAIYRGADPRIHVESLPRPVADMQAFDAVIDLSDFAYRPSFDTTPMVDFFLQNLGLDPQAVSPDEKTNHWLRDTHPIGEAETPYVLFCPQSSARLRTIPPDLHAPCIARLSREFGLPVWGFSQARVPGFVDVTARSTTLEAFIALIAGATHVVSTDSAALHLAAGFARPTTGLFISIAPELRSRDYPCCTSIHLDPAGRLAGLHETDDPALLQYAQGRWEAHVGSCAAAEAHFASSARIASITAL